MGAMKIRIDVDDTRLTATLDDTAASRDFASLLLLTLALEDYNRTEKISDLPERLSTQGAPPVSTRQGAILPTTRRGATLPSSTRIFRTRAGS
jgi:hypothetical protein